MTELPLRTGELNAVSLERSLAGAALAELLPLGDQPRDPPRQLFFGRAGTAAPKTRRPQMPQ